MAKISTYPNVGTPTLSDMLIGTEVTDDNATKNFQISDILGLIGSLGLYVPYTGATANVDLGSFGLDAFNIAYTGSLYAVPGSVSIFGDTVVIEKELRDGFNQPGTAGQILSSTGTLTQWINPSAFSLNLQQVLDDGNTADQNIILTGASNKFEQTGNNSFINQTGTTSFIVQTGATAFISQTGLNAYISQSGNNGRILQTGTDSLIQQQGINSAIRQIGANSSIDQSGANAYISQAGLNSIIEQTGDNATVTQSGADAIIEQTGVDASIQQTGTNGRIEQTGANASIEQTGANAFIKQTGTTGYIKPAQILDSTSSLGAVDDVLVSLGPGLGVKWKAISQFGSFFDSTNQNTTAGVAAAMKFGTNDLTGFGVSVTNDGLGNKTQIEVTESGVYNVQFSAQLRNGAGASVVDIWFRLNGGNIANSNTSVSLQSNTNEVASWNYFIDLNPGDIFQIMWTHDNAAFLSAAAAAAPHPATPSTILTVNRVR